jgi:hypothetical protein
MKKFLKRFQRLENTTLNVNILPDKELTTSKRFMKLEVNEKSIQFTIEDKVAVEETAPAGKTYFFLCPYCGGQNAADLEVCSYCKRQLKKQYVSDYTGQANLLKKCVCGAVNLKERKNCWVCGRDFSLWGDEAVKESPENIITLNIDGTIYKSTDASLPPGIVALMEKIRREGYSEELVNEWMRGKNQEEELKKENIQTQISVFRWEIFWRVAGIVFIGVIFFIRLGCESAVRHY